MTGLNDFPKDDRPPVWLPFQMYHLMVGLGMGFILLTLGTLPLLRKGRIFGMRWLLWIYVFAVFGAMLANQAGWIAAEVGRQPWLVHPAEVDGVQMRGLRTADGLSEAVTAEQVLWSIIMFGLIYLLLFFVWIFVLNNKIQHGPDEPEPETEPGERTFLKTAATMTGRSRSLTETSTTEKP